MENKLDKSSKKIAAMFNDIAPQYDFLNHLLSLGIDKGWRKKLVRKVAQENPSTILDVATGTGDLAIALHRRINAIITGVDISVNMLEIAQKKVATLSPNTPTFQLASAEALPFPDHSFDAVTVAFGVRNFENLTIGLQELRRVLKPGGILAIIECSTPTHFPIKQIYAGYFHSIIPLIGRFFSKHRSAYAYLPASVSDFPQRADFVKYLKEVGFTDTQYKNLSFGIAMLYLAK